MKKFKVTLNEYGNVRAVVINGDWYNIQNDIQNNGLILDNVIKVELYLHVDDEDVQDLTQQ